MRKKNKRLDLITVIAKVKHISEDKYEGKVYDHILTIFNELTTAEKRTLLRGLINICFIVEDKVLVNHTDLNHLSSNSPDTLPKDIKYDRRRMVSDVLDNEDNITTHGDKAIISKMKRLTSKADIILLISGILLVLTAITQFEPNVYNSIVKYIFHLFKFIIVL